MSRLLWKVVPCLVAGSGIYTHCSNTGGLETSRPRAPLPILPICTPRCLLRRFKATGEELMMFQDYRTDPQLAKYQGWSPVSDSEAWDFITDQSQLTLGHYDGWVQVAIELRDDETNAFKTERKHSPRPQLVGDLGVHIDARTRTLELGYTVSSAYHRRGIASEAVQGLLQTLFSAGLIDRVRCITAAQNTPSQGLLHKFGFSEVGREQSMQKGRPVVEVTFELTAEKWNSLFGDKER